MVDTVGGDRRPACNRLNRTQGRTPMSQRRRTVPPTRKHSRSARSGREGLIAKEKTKKQSARKRTALDNRFHRTFLRWAACGLHVPARLTPEPAENEAARPPSQRTAAHRLLRSWTAVMPL